MRYQNRNEAGELLDKYLSKMEFQADLIIGLPRGGLVVASVVADNMRIPLDFVLVKKIGPPGNPEYAIAIVTLDGEIFKGKDEYVIAQLPSDYLTKTASNFHRELKERDKTYRKVLVKREVKNKKVLLIDDGLATGLSVEAALHYLLREGASEVIVAAPVSSRESVERLKIKASDVIILHVPDIFYAVGEFYNEFYPVSEEEILNILMKEKEKWMNQV